MIPSTRLLRLVAVLGGIGLLSTLLALAALIWFAAALAVTVAALADLALGWRQRAPSVRREVARSMALLSRAPVRLVIEREDPRMARRVVVFDHHPESFETDGLPRRVELEPGRRTTVEYTVRPTLRGACGFPGIELRVASPLGLWWRRRFVAEASLVRVYPDFSRVTKLLLQAVHNPLATTGLHVRRQRGEGLEFHQLRDYREGDSLRALDWKATSRMGRMISREYRDERDQHIVFVVDAGRRMLTKDGALSHFDHTLNALLLLAYVALRQGDSVSIMTVGETRSWLAPRKGPGAINAVLNHIYDVEPAPIEVDYLAAATELSVLQRRRALIVLLTNVREEDSDDLSQATQLLRRRNLVMLASLRERALDEAQRRPVTSLDDALLVTATDHYLAARRAAQDLLRAGGVFVEDCLCEELPQAITNRYLAIKRAGML